MLLIVRFLFGAGEAGALPNSARVLARWFPAGALVLVYAHSTPDSPASTRFRDQIGDLIGLASCLEQAADQARSPDQ